MLVVTESGRLLEETWFYLDSRQSTATSENLILSFEQFKSKFPKIKETAGGIGIELAPEFDVSNLQAYLSEINMILLCFDVFSDGRAFSQVSLLRNRYGFTGEIRAIGDVIPDQLDFMRRCGFSQFQLKNDLDYRLAQEIFAGTPYRYQSALDIRSAC